MQLTLGDGWPAARFVDTVFRTKLLHFQTGRRPLTGEVALGLYPIVTLGKQLLNMIGNLV